MSSVPRGRRQAVRPSSPAHRATEAEKRQAAEEPAHTAPLGLDHGGWVLVIPVDLDTLGVQGEPPQNRREVRNKYTK